METKHVYILTFSVLAVALFIAFFATGSFDQPPDYNIPEYKECQEYGVYNGTVTTCKEY